MPHPGEGKISRKQRREPFQQTTPAMIEWRERNPLAVWAREQPYGAYARMAADAGVSVKAVYAWMAGRSLPAADVLLALCDRAKVSIRSYIEWWRQHPCRDA